MTKSKATKKALLSSVVALLLCFTMLMGATFAWFTDNVSSTGNRIQAGDLEVDLVMDKLDGAGYMSIADGTGDIFSEATGNGINWEPGKTEIVYLGVRNNGSLALKYNILLDIVDNGLIGSLEFAIVDGATSADVFANWDEVKAASNGQTGDIVAGQIVAAQGGVLDEIALSNEEFETDYFALAVHMKEDAGNEFENKSITIDVKVVATQKDAEVDSFGSTYDENSKFPPREVSIPNDATAEEVEAVFENAMDGDIITMPASFNTQSEPLTEAIAVDKEITVVPNGMYLVSEAPSTFTVAEGGKLTIAEGSFTIMNTATEGAAVTVDGGEFVMAGGSFNAHTAVRTTAGKSSTVTLAAGWSNKVTVGFDSKGNDTINVTGGSLYTSKEAIKTTAGTDVEINISGGLLSSGTTQYSAAIQLNSPATVNITGGTVAATYLSGLNGSSAIEANVAPTEINISGDAKLSGKGWGVVLGSHWSSPSVLSERFVLNVSGNASITADGDTGFGIRYCQDACDVTISGNAKVSAKFQAVQMNSNSYAFTNSTLTIKDNATITSTAGRYGGGYALAVYGNTTITGGTITGSTAGLAAGGGATIIVDNSTSGTPITINSTSIDSSVNYIVNGNPTIG